MRVKYSFTTDIKDVPNGVHFHLSRFLGRDSTDSNLQQFMDLLLQDELNLSLISKKSNELREQIGKLDMLLAESSVILSACEHYEKCDNLQQPVAPPRPPAQPRVAQKEPTPPTPPTQPQQSETEKMARIQKNIAQMNNVAQTLNRMKGSKPWESLEQEGK